MASPKKSLLSAEELYRLPDDNLKHELERGYLLSEPLPGGQHGHVAANITFALQSWARRTGAGVVYTCDTGFVLARNPDTVRGPDVAFLSARRYRLIRDHRRYIAGAPDLAVEVVSPGNGRARMMAKIADYLDADGSVVWIADPQSETIAVHTRDDAIVLGIDAQLSAPDLLPGFAVDVSELFRAL